MSRMMSRYGRDWLPGVRGGWEKRLRRQDRTGPPPELLVAGVVVAGLGLLAWAYLGPDLKRYLKIHAM